MSLTGVSLLLLAITLAAALPALLAWWWHRKAHTSWLAAASHLAAVLLCEVFAASALFLWVNDQYGFYTSWSDLIGAPTKGVTIQSNRLVPPGAGRVEILTVQGRTQTDPVRQTLVWLPPQYDQAAYRTARFPVVMVLPGQPSTPEAMLRQYDFARTAVAEISAGRIKPFVAVLPPLMTNPPRDTECTNVVGGPQAQTWLTSTIHTAVQNSLRTAPAPWSVMGWSTGAFCSAKLVLTHPQEYQAAVAFGGYFSALTDKTTGDLFHGSTAARQANSPIWLYQHGGLHGRKLLMVSGRQDLGTWASTERMLQVSRGDPNVSFIAFPTGGHNYRNYRHYLSAALQWLDHNHVNQ
jgi:dienelactone hydrolase